MRQNGLTLIEVMVALAIVAAGLAIALPAVRTGPSGLDLEAAARQVAGSLRDARGAAIASGRPTSFALDVASGRFGWDRPQQLHGKAAGIALALVTTEDRQRSRTTGSIGFFPDGGSTGGGVELAGAGRRITVVVDWLNGGVRVVRNGSR